MNSPDRSFEQASDGGIAVAVCCWDADVSEPKAVVHIVHGMAEHARRYGRLARALNRAGYIVYAHDHRGHGATDTGTLGYFGAAVAGRDSWSLVIDDLHRVNRRIAEEHPGLSQVMLGHSMGSLALQTYLYSYPETLAGAVISATSTGRGAGVVLGQGLAKVEARRVGVRGSSVALQLTTFGDFNRRFWPTRTDFDWLSRDEAEVDKYIADPLCGFPLTTQAWHDLFVGMTSLSLDSNRAKVPAGMPILLTAGSEDPVGGRGKAIVWLLEAYRRAGVKNVESRTYPDARHELFNEINRDEVTRDLIDWLDRTLGHGG